ncbi:MAG: superoxide dismutase [Clostridia bacterium]|jgi:Fe-Mn family superoxide dismutase|nr:superoxide dismutase [Clostridia bacterium]
MKDLLPLIFITLATSFNNKNNFRASTPSNNMNSDDSMSSNNNMFANGMPSTNNMSSNGMPSTNNMSSNGMPSTNNMSSNGMPSTNDMSSNNFAASTGPFRLPPLGYAYNALEPYIDEATMKVHHTGHHQTYVDKLNEALSKYPQLYNVSLETLLNNIDRLPSDIREAVRNNGGGHYNHSFFWKVMTPNRGTAPNSSLRAAIDRDFGSFENFRNEFKQTALNTFGSGWTWLLKDDSGKLQIVSTPNQNTPVPLGLVPIIAIDLWEHAYYLKHQNRRNNYIDDWFNVVNWDYANQSYNA